MKLEDAKCFPPRSEARDARAGPRIPAHPKAPGMRARAAVRVIVALSPFLDRVNNVDSKVSLLEKQRAGSAGMCGCGRGCAHYARATEARSAPTRATRMTCHT